MQRLTEKVGATWLGLALALGGCSAPDMPSKAHAPEASPSCNVSLLYLGKGAVLLYLATSSINGTDLSAAEVAWGDGTSERQDSKRLSYSFNHDYTNPSSYSPLGTVYYVSADGNREQALCQAENTSTVVIKDPSIIPTANPQNQ